MSTRPSAEPRPALGFAPEPSRLAGFSRSATVTPIHDHPSRYCDRPFQWRTRLLGFGSTSLVMLAVLGLALITWQTVSRSSQPPVPLVVTLLPLASPPEPAEVPEGPRQVKQAEQIPEPKKVVPEQALLVPPVATISTPVTPPTEPAERVDPVPETTAPKSIPAPSAQRAASDADPTWEGKLLAHLEKYRRYPSDSRAQRKQGVVHVRFRMNRIGKVLSSAIVRSSGTPALDRAALDTLKRAQPLPAIPADRPAELDLSVPVEFFVR